MTDESALLADYVARIAQLTAERDEAQSEAAAMRTLLKRAADALTVTKAWMHAETVPLSQADEFDRVDYEAMLVITAIDMFKPDTAGRVLAERVKLWRELEAAVRQYDTIIDIDRVIRVLAALDTKDGQ